MRGYIRHGGFLCTADEGSRGEVSLGHLSLLVGGRSLVGRVVNLRLPRVEDLGSVDQGEKGGGRMKHPASNRLTETVKNLRCPYPYNWT